MQRNALDNLLGSLDVTVRDISAREVSPHKRLAFEACEAPTIHFIHCGQGHFDNGNGGSILVASDCLIIAPRGFRQVFEARSRSTNCGKHFPDEPLQVITVRLAAGFGAELGVFDGLVEPIVETMSDDPVVRESFHRLSEECLSPDLGSRALSNALVMQCVILMIRQLARRDESTVEYLAALSDPRISAALALVAHSTDGSLSVAAMADAAGMTKSAFARVFTATLGQSPIDFMGRARLHKAAGLLQTTPMPIKAVAWTVGFASRSHFSRAFKAAYGKDPSAYRRGGEPREERGGPRPSVVAGKLVHSAVD